MIWRFFHRLFHAPEAVVGECVFCGKKLYGERLNGGYTLPSAICDGCLETMRLINAMPDGPEKEAKAIASYEAMAARRQDRGLRP